MVCDDKGERGCLLQSTSGGGGSMLVNWHFYARPVTSTLGLPTSLMPDAIVDKEYETIKAGVGRGNTIMKPWGGVLDNC